MTEVKQSDARRIKTSTIIPNPHNPRRYFNDSSLDQLKNSIQEVGVLVPLIVYESSTKPGTFVLLDGERRWKSALELGIETVPVNIISEPSLSDNLLRMFNIHSVRDDWPLVSVALAIREIVSLTGEERETSLSDMTGLTRSTVRRAKRILSLPEYEIDLISKEAHLDRPEQVHREDLYLEILAATSLILNQVPELSDEFSREQIIRQFAEKREKGTLTAVTDFRSVGKLVKAIGLVPRESIVTELRRIITDVDQNPTESFERIAAAPTEHQALLTSVSNLDAALALIAVRESPSDEIATSLKRLRQQIDRVLGQT